jgi:superfamily II DNA/RNA helicase
MNAGSYHAGKTDQQRQAIQKMFISNQIRCLVCTIAFSMGIDKSDIQSVIHYDMPKSIENYVQEIGRAGRDGTLARCHMFLNNDDFFQIRRLILSDLLDNYNALKLTNKIIVESKRQLLKVVKPELVPSKKRKAKSISGGGGEDPEQRLIDDFEHEDELKLFYTRGVELKDRKIKFDQFKQFAGKMEGMYLFLDAKETTGNLDLKREVVMTMLNSLERLEGEKKFFRFEGVLPSSIGIRFHKSKPQDIADSNDFIATFLTLAKEHQGVHRCST